MESLEINRIIPNISSTKMGESKDFYTKFLGLRIVMDLHWVLTCASTSNPTAQINLVRSEKNFDSDDHITISIEVA